MNLTEDLSNIRVAIIGGALETSLHPIPPVADGAPEWNVFRLVEAARRLDIRVISPCTETQLALIRRITARGHYSQVVFSLRWLRTYRGFFQQIYPLRLFARRVAAVPDLLSWRYLQKVKIWLMETQPDLVFINARPQYIRYLRQIVPAGRLYLMMRGPLGESRRYLPMLDGIVVNSDGMKDYASRFVAGSHVPIWKIPNTLGHDFLVDPVSSDRFTRVPRRIVFAGRIVPEKGVMELLQAFDLVKKSESDVELHLCGAHGNLPTSGVPTVYERRVADWVRIHGPGTVRVEGYVPTRDMGKYYCQSALAVFPSRRDIYTESFGMVALEAMRCGTPVVASRQPGFEELVISGETGLLVDDPRNARCLAEAMLQVLRNPELAAQMGRAGYRRSLSYTPEAAACRFEEMIVEALQRADKRASVEQT